MNATQQPFFEAIDLHFGYRRDCEAVRGIHLAIQPGEFTAIIGPNGAGKSTLLHLLLGLLEPQSGEARIEGRSSSRIEPEERARRVAFVPQASRILFPYTVAEIAAMGRHAHLAPLSDLSPADREKVEEALRVTGIWELRNRPFAELSGGEAQRAIIARAIAQDAPSLLLDEPTSSLDLYYQSAIYDLLTRLNRERGITVLIVTHDVNLAAQYCRRLIGVKAGGIAFDGTPTEVVTNDGIGGLYSVEAEVIELPGGPVIRARPSSR